MSNEIKTFEEAKQKVAENLNYKSIKDVILSSWIVEDLEGHIDSVYNEAANLWQQSNLDRIAFLERLSENFGEKEKEFKREIFRLQNVAVGFVNEIESQRLRIKELEEGESIQDVWDLFYVENDSNISKWSNKKRLAIELKDWLTKNNYRFIKAKELLNKTT